MRELADSMTAADRDITDLEMIGGTRVVLPDDTWCAGLGQALESVPERMALGFTSFCVKRRSPTTTRGRSARSARTSYDACPPSSESSRHLPLRRNARNRRSGQVLITSSAVSQPRWAVPMP
jgi:hypothetical protein